MSPERLLGAVLAGGKSRRYGRAKHAETVGGVSMLARAVAVLRSVTSEVVVISTAPLEGVDDVPVLPDLVPGRGPLGGLHAALSHAGGLGLDGAFLLACDLPLVDERTVRRLVGEMRGPLIAPYRAGGGIEPLCAAYSIETLPEVERRLASDDLSLHALFREVGGSAVELGADVFLNVNTPEDRNRAERSLTRRSAP